MNLFDLSGRLALVTGAGQGIGLSLAQGLASAGARVVLNGRDEAKLARAAATIPGAAFAAFDVTEPAAVAEAVARIEAEQGAIDILVNNAGIQRRAPLQDFTVEDWHAVIAANLHAVFYVGQAVARHMIPRGRGKIINIASLTSEVARPTIAPYAASKGGVRQLTRGMCADWARHGLQINAIGPGYIETPLNRALLDDEAFSNWVRQRTPAGRWGRVEDLHGAVVFLASAAADYVNGQTIYVDGGMLAVL